MTLDLLSALPASLQQLQYIVAVAELGSSLRAAEACHVAAPLLAGVEHRSFGNEEVGVGPRPGHEVVAPSRHERRDSMPQAVEPLSELGGEHISFASVDFQVVQLLLGV